MVVETTKQKMLHSPTRCSSPLLLQKAPLDDNLRAVGASIQHSQAESTVSSLLLVASTSSLFPTHTTRGERASV